MGRQGVHLDSSNDAVSAPQRDRGDVVFGSRHGKSHDVRRLQRDESHSGFELHLAVDGTAWKNLSPSTVPIPRGWGIADLDPLHHNVVLTGGTGDTIRTDNTWTWDGTNWTSVPPAVQVEAMIGAGYAFDPALQEVVVFGGVAETWTWNGTTWAQLSPTNSPSARSGVGMAYDHTTRQTILFGGQLANGPMTNETWEFVAP